MNNERHEIKEMRVISENELLNEMNAWSAVKQLMAGNAGYL